MSLSADFHGRHLDRSATEAIRFLADPTAPGRAYAESLTDDPYPNTSVYPYSLGVAISLIGQLLDALGYCDHGPDRFDCEWALTHPVDADCEAPL